MAAPKGRFAALQAFLAGAMGQHPARVGAFLDAIDDATAARLLAAAESGDTRPLLKAMAEQTWGTAPARQAPPAAEPPAGRDPLSFRDRIANEPKVREGLEDAGVSTEGMTQPQMLKEYVRTVRGSAAPRGRPRSAEDSIRELAKPQDQVAAESIAEQFDQAAGLIPYGSRGPGVAVGGSSGPGVAMGPSTALVPSQPRGLTVVDASPPDAMESAARELAIVDASPRVEFDDNPSRIPEPLDPEDPFVPVVSERPRLGYEGPRGPGVPVDGVARDRPTALTVPRRRAEMPDWVPYAATAGVVGGLGATIYSGTRPDDVPPTGNVEDDLDASATSVTPDPEVKAKPEQKAAGEPAATPTQNEYGTNERGGKYLLPRPGESVEDYAIRNRAALREELGGRVRAVKAGSAARQSAAVRQAMAEESPPISERAEVEGGTWTSEPFQPPRLRGPGVPDWAQGAFGATRANVDGVDVNAYDLGDGDFRYRMRDVRLAQEDRARQFADAGGEYGVTPVAGDDGQRSAGPRRFSSPDQSRQYRTRPVDPKTGNLMPSQYDIDMLKNGFEAVFNEKGEIVYRRAAVGDGPGPEGMAPSAQRYSRFLQGTQADTGDTARKPGSWDVVQAATPFGSRVPVLVPTQASREQTAAAVRNAVLKRQGDWDARQQAVIRRAQARQNPLEYLGRGDINDWQRMAMAEQFLRQPQTVTPLTVQAANNAQLAQLGLRVANGQGFQQLTPDQETLLRLKAAEAERQAPPEERAATYRTQKEIHPSELDAVDGYVSQMYSAPGWAIMAGGNSSEFTVDEQQKVIDHLVNNKQYKLEKAQRIVDEIARRRAASSYRGNPVREG